MICMICDRDNLDHLDHNIIYIIYMISMVYMVYMTYMVYMIYKYMYDHSFWGGFGQEFFPSRPQYAILGTGILGQIASFERRLRGAAQTPLALPYPFRIWPGSGTWAE